MAKWLDFFVWHDPNVSLPSIDEEVLGAYLDVDGEWYFKIIWRTSYKDVITDKYGFPILDSNESLIAWKPIDPPNIRNSTHK